MKWISAGLLGVVTILALSCSGGGDEAQRSPDAIPPPPPPSALTAIRATSDARVDSANRLLGSFVGEGTHRAIHLLSSDTALIADLYRRFGTGSSPNPSASVWSRLRPDRGAGEPGRSLGALTIVPANSGPTLEEAIAGFARGQARVEVLAIVLRGTGCGPRDAQAEIIVAEAGTGGGGPAPFQGPVLVSFQTRPRTPLASSEIRRRVPPAPPSPSRIDSLIRWSEQAMDADLARRAPADWTPFLPRKDRWIEVNTLATIDAVDLIPLRIGAEERYAVALRLRRIMAGADTLLAATVMLWDSAGTESRVLLEPTLLALRRGRMSPVPGFAPLYWRRLESIAGFGLGPDFIWLEQVSPTDGAVLWAVLSPVDHTTVAAARVGRCNG